MQPHTASCTARSDMFLCVLLIMYYSTFNVIADARGVDTQRAKKERRPAQHDLGVRAARVRAHVCARVLSAECGFDS